MKRSKTHSMAMIGLLSLILGLFTPEQGKAQRQEITLKGVIMDSVTNETIPYATIAITPMRGAQQLETLQQVTDDMGRFAVLVPSAEEYSLLASFVGKKMNPLKVSYERVQSGAMVRVRMQDRTEELSTVTVTAARPLVRIDADRIAYNVTDDPMSKSENLRDMLRKVPLVTVDGEGNVQVKGSSNFRIYLNGKPSSMMSSNPKEVLRSIPATSIKKVEVITDPGVKYDAEGVNAILNIVTDSTSLEGYTGTLSFNASPLQPYLSPSLFFTGKIGKLGITTNYSYWDYRTTISTETHTDIDFTHGKQRELSRMPDNKAHGHYGSLNLTYDFNPKNLLSADVSFNLYDSKNRTLSENRLTQTTGVLQDAYEGNTHNKSHSGSIEANIDYQHSTDRENELLTLSYRLMHSPSGSEQNMDLNYTHRGGVAIVSPLPLQQRSHSRAALNEHTVQIDYTRPFGTVHLIDVGAKTIFRRGSSHSTYELFNPIQQTWEKGSLFGQHVGIASAPMKYQQDIYGVYANYTAKLTDFTLIAGVRGEYGIYNVRFDDLEGANFSRTFLDLVPQVTLSYQLSNMQQLKLSYNYRVARPNIRQLNPYRTQQSPTLISEGNPDINNSKMHHLNLSYNYYSQKFTLMASLQGGYSNDNITQIMYLDKENPTIVHASWGNYGTSRNMGGNVFINYTPKPWLRIYANGNLTHYYFEARNQKNPQGEAYTNSQQGFGGVSYLGATITLPKKWTVGLNGGFFAQEPRLGHSSVYGTWHNMSLSKALFKNRLTLSAFVNNPFMPYQTFRVTTTAPGFRGEVAVKQFMFNGGIGISYNFGQMKSQIRKVQRTIVNDDLSKAKGSESQQGIGQGQGGK
ncbi:TonB-dependent receptor domain-containing protein [Porphyromonas circumdentaria]|uniref:TonB-dependent receptor domain-containing protein n=1 Tax=Porphyromonas circumdentaria TaxID=29524 RepID=UPI0026DC2B3A|nr:TonB-dependent receptor [Porphyromonas circumdentaria]MDO4722087.1 TonB-dependent receptor [Porphyromonas circumdentaria]